MSKIWVVLTDDWELRGNGTGTVEDFQRRPALRLMDLYESLGIRATFNLEVMQQVAFERHADRHAEIRAGRDAWIRTVRDMSARGFDTQLHVHPQWWLADYVDGWWKLGRRWNIADYAPEEIETIFNVAFAYAGPLIAPRTIGTFRAGSWGMGPPSQHVLKALVSRGVKVDISIAAGLRYAGDGISLDYSRVESPYRAYFPDPSDIRSVNRSTTRPQIIEIPTQTVTHRQLFGKLCRDLGRGVSWTELRPLRAFLTEWLHTRASTLARKVIPRSPAVSSVATGSDTVPDFVMRDPFGVLAGRADFGLVIDISGKIHPSVFCHMADIAIERARKDEHPEVKVLVFENHTKDLRDDRDFERIRILIEHIRAKHADVAFRTLAHVVEALPHIA